MAGMQLVNNQLAISSAELPDRSLIPDTATIVNNSPRNEVVSKLDRFLLILAVLGTFSFLGFIIGFAENHTKVEEATRNKGKLPTMESVLVIENWFLSVGTVLAALISGWPLLFGNMVDLFARFFKKFQEKKWYVFIKQLLFTVWVFGWLGFSGFIFKSDMEVNMSRCISSISLFTLCLLTSIMILKKINYGDEKNQHFYGFVSGYSLFTLLAGFQSRKNDDLLMLLLFISVSVICFVISFMLKLQEMNTPHVEEAPADEVQRFLLESIAKLNVDRRLAAKELAQRDTELLAAKKEIQNLRASSSTSGWLRFG